MSSVGSGMVGGMKILGFVLVCLAIVLIVPIMVGVPGVSLGLVMVVAFGLLVAGAVVYGIGRAVEELTLIRKYLKQQHYSDSAKAADLMDQIRRVKDGQP